MTGRSRRCNQAGGLMLALLLAVLAGCARIPTAGPVGKSSEGSAGNLSAPVFLPAAPQPGASPETIIDYFYRAGSGYEDDYAVAREYLTQASSVAWKPDQRALVYREATRGGHRRRKRLQLRAGRCLHRRCRRHRHPVAGRHHREHPGHGYPGGR